MRLETWLKRRLPPIEYMIEPWLQVGSIVLLHGPRGVSKTNLGMAIALDVANGGGFFACPRPRKVLYVDGEMQRTLVQDRLRKFCRHTPRPQALSNLEYLNYADLEDPKGVGIQFGFGDLAKPDAYGRDRISEELGYLRCEDESEPVLLVLDNKSALMSTPDDNNATPQLHNFMLWLRDLRAQNVTTMLIHHDGKTAGRQNGTSALERVPDTIISVTPNGAPADGCIPTRWQFSKARSFIPGSGDTFIDIHYDDERRLAWLSEGSEPVALDPEKEAVVETWKKNPELTVRQLSEITGVSKSAVARLLRPFRDSGTEN